MADSLPPETVEPPGTSAPRAQAVQGVVGGVPVPISGSFSVTATTTVKATAAAPTYVEGTDNPISADLSGNLRTLATLSGASSFSDGSVDRQARVKDADTGAGTHWTAEVILQKSASGGPVDFGTSTDPVRVDPTGATTQPVSAASLPLPTGAAQEHTGAASFHAARLTDGAAFYKPTTPSDTQPVSAATLPLPSGASTEATLALIKAKTDNLDVLLSTRTKPADTQTIAGTVTSNQGTANATPWNENVAQWGGSSTTLGQKAMASSVPVVVASDQSAIPVSGTVTSNQGTAAAIAGAWPVKLTDGTNTTGVTTSSEAKVNAPDAQTTGTVAATAQTVILTLGGNKSTCVVQISGVWVGTLVFDGFGKSATTFSLSGFDPLSHINSQTAIANGVFIVPVGGMTKIQVRGVAWTSGTATVDMNCGSSGTIDQFTYTRIQDASSAGPVTAVKAASTAAVAADPALVVAVSPNNTVSVVPPTLTKGTQGATGFSTQNLKDAGRVNIMWTAEVAGAATTEGLLTVTESRDGAATTTFTSKVVTNAKRLRITSLQIAIETLGSGTAPQRVYLRLRFNTAGAVTTASPLQGSWECVNNAAIVKSGATFAADFPDGVEFAGDGTKQIGFTVTFPDWVTTTATVQAKLTITAFEY